MALDLSRTAAALIWGLAGSIAFFVVFDRIILQMDQCRSKTVLTYSFLACITILPALAGYWTGFSPWLSIPLIALNVFLMGEVIRHLLRRKHFGSKSRTRPLRRPTGHLFDTTHTVVLREYDLSSDRLPPLRIVQMTDFHLDDRFDPDYFRSCVDAVRDIDPDLLLLTGDFVNESRHTELIRQNFGELPGRFGVFASLGNHDYWAGADLVRTALRECGIRVLSGTCEHIETDTGAAVMVCGHEAPWGGFLPVESLKVDPDIPRIVMCHTPDGIFDLSQHPVDLVFSGHLHGGQWRFPLIGSLVAPSTHGRLLDLGHFRYNRTDLIVSAGLGVIWIPIRLNCPPEITVVHVNQPVAQEPARETLSCAMCVES